MTDRDQGAFETALQADLAAARQQNLVQADQLRAAEARNEAQSHRIDFLIAEVARVTASREQYERVAIRVSAKMESATSMMMGQLAELQDEISDAAFTKPAGTVETAPATPVVDNEPASEEDRPLRGIFTESDQRLEDEESARARAMARTGEASHGPTLGRPKDSFSLEILGKLIGAAQPAAISAAAQIGHTSADLLPPQRFWNGAAK